MILPLQSRTRKKFGEIKFNGLNVKFISPLGYLAMVMLEKNARLIATDPGGMQKEAFFHKVPCVTLRDEIEWVELVEAGWNRLSPPLSANELRTSLLEAIGTKEQEIMPYGRGDAAHRIASILTLEKT